MRVLILYDLFDARDIHLIWSTTAKAVESLLLEHSVSRATSLLLP
jgi:hypothetical protein